VVRTQVRLTEQQAYRLRRVAAERGVSIAQGIREAIERHVYPEASLARRQRALAAIGGFRSGLHDVSEAHDRHLAE